MTGYVRQSTADIIDGEVVFAAPLNAEFNAIQGAFNSTSGHTHSGGAGEGPKINLTTSVTGVLPIVNGGTGSGSALGARTNLGLGTAAVANTGTSGHTLPFLDTENTWSTSQEFSSNIFVTGSIRDTEIDSFLLLGGSLTGGATLTLYGESHATTPDLFRTSADLYQFRNTSSSDLLVLSAAGITSVGTIDIPGGSASLPAYTFTGDLNTGMYRLGADSIGFSVGGTLAAFIQSDLDFHVVGNIIAPIFFAEDGTVTDPSISFSADPNTGLYRVSENVLGITAAGVQRASFSTAITFTGNTSVTGTFSSTGNTSIGGDLSVTGSTTLTSLTNSGSTTLTGNVTTSAKFIAPTGGGPSLPTYTFSGDTDTGMWRSSTDQLSLGTSGVAALVITNNQSVQATNEISSLGIVRVPAGSAAAPTFTFTGSTTNGMYRSGTNEVSISTNGTLAATFQSDGDLVVVGNVETPRTLLGNGTAALPSHSFSGDPNTGMYRSGADTLSFSTNGTLAATISSTGALTTVGAITSGGGITATGTVAVTGNITATTTIAATGNITANGRRVAEVYTGTGASDVDFPIGHTVLVDCNTSVDRNATISIYLNTGNTVGYTSDAGGTELTGTWRSRGLVGDIALFERVA